MPNIAEFHPQIVHFVIAGAGLGILFRWISLSGKMPWTNGAAATLLLIGATAGWLAVRSGTEAHGPAERVPGAVRAVQEHEHDGETTRNILLVIAAFEIVALVPAAARARRAVLFGSAALGVWGAWSIYETGKAGGELVYSYAGGVGIRSGDTTDVNRLVMAAIYHRAALSRTQKNADGAAAGFADLAVRFPQDETVQIMAAESLILDRHDYAGALRALAAIPQPADTARTFARYQFARADAYIGAGLKDSARLILEPMAAKAPANKRITDRLEKAK